MAAWQAGVGRVLCYTGEADGKYTGPIAAWPQAGEFFCSLARWVSAQDQGLGPDMLLTQELRGGTCLVQLHLDSERDKHAFQLAAAIDHSARQRGAKPAAERLPLELDFGRRACRPRCRCMADRRCLTSLDLPGVGRTTLPPTCLPYSAEFALRAEGEGLQTLQRMARATGGIERVNLGTIWNDLPSMPRMVSFAPWLLLAAMALLLVEILQRRTGLLSLRRRALQATRSAQAASAPAASAQAPRRSGGQQPRRARELLQRRRLSPRRRMALPRLSRLNPRRRPKKR